MSTPSARNFEEVALEQARRGILREYWDFVCYNKKWWLMPIILVLLLLTVLLLLSGSAVAPFIYTLF